MDHPPSTRATSPGHGGPAVADALDRRRRRTQLAFAVLIALLFLADISIGPVRLQPADLWRALSGDAEQGALPLKVLWELRLPQSLMACLAGACLGLAGAEMQTALDNPLASPFTLGVSSAAALGAALVLVLPFSIPGVDLAWLLVLSALSGGLLCTVAIQKVARHNRLGTQGIILLGIVLVFSFNALLSLTQLLANAASLQSLVFWMMGSLSRAQWSGILVLGPAFALAMTMAIGAAGALTALRFGDDRAAGFGVDTARVRRHALLRASLLASLCVALVGVIGFVGIMAPHIARRFWGEDQRWLLPGSALCGAIILLAASAASKLALPPAIIPVGIITTVVGIPFFIAALWRRPL